MSTDNNNRKTKDIGALWLRETDAGKKYYFGKITVDGKETRFVVYSNDYKEPNSQQPDWRIYLSIPKGNPPAKAEAPAPKAAPQTPKAQIATQGRPPANRAPVKPQEAPKPQPNPAPAAAPASSEPDAADPTL